MSHRAVVALGGNVGDRNATLASAVEALQSHPEIEVRAVSTFIETVALKPDGPDESAPAFLNGVTLLETSLDVVGLHDFLQVVELRHGRVRELRWGDRTLDLDLIDFDGEQFMSEHLVVPHPRAHERLFVLAPWLEIDPNATLPNVGSVARAIEELS